ncbi:MAG: DUF5688 family protein [Lachnospiraceae bacterium]|nr:DUF5688 family protein [Lachnospiraceae bacterium]
MDFTDYKHTMLCKVQLFLGNEYEVSEQRVTKNNGVVLTGIMAKKQGINTFPTIYIDEYYNEELTSEDVEYLSMKLAKSLTKAELPKSIELEQFTDYERVRDRLKLKLVNADKNKDLLFEVPYKRFLNLAVLYYYQVEEELFEGRASIMIRNSHLSMWGIDQETLDRDAMDSVRIISPAKICPMRELLAELYGDDFLKEDFPMYVMTNKEKYYGASTMMYRECLKKFADEKETDFYVLPSSVHEVILVPADENADAKMLLETVTDINRTQVDREEILADSVYYYDREKDELSWIG